MCTQEITQVRVQCLAQHPFQCGLTSSSDDSELPSSSSPSSSASTALGTNTLGLQPTPDPMSGASSNFKSACFCSAAAQNEQVREMKKNHSQTKIIRPNRAMLLFNVPSKSEPPLVLKCFRSLISSSACMIKSPSEPASHTKVHMTQVYQEAVPASLFY